MIDKTIARAHACATGVAVSNAEAEALGRSKVGFTTTVYTITDALGKPMDLIVGQASDIGQAEALLQLTLSDAGELLGEKGYESDAFVMAIKKTRYASCYRTSLQFGCSCL